jgi:plastocyanin
MRRSLPARPPRVIVAGAAVLLAALGLSGCGGGTASKSSGGRAGDTITIKGFAFSPTPLKARVGQKVTVTNEDSAKHTITADDKSFDSKDLAKGQIFSFTPAKAGTYTYTCTIHSYMKGEVDVS